MSLKNGCILDGSIVKALNGVFNFSNVFRLTGRDLENGGRRARHE